MTPLVASLLVIASAQVNTDSLRRVQIQAIDQQRARTNTAAAAFLDRTRPAQQRVAATARIVAFAERPQVDSAIAIAFDAQEPLSVRTRALQLVGHRAGEDTSFSRRLQSLATDGAAPVELRREAVKHLGVAAFGSFAMHALQDDVVRTLRTAARDPDLGVRRGALRTLAGQGDSAALNLLRAGLEDTTQAQLPPSEAVELLSMHDPAPSFDVLRRTMRQPPDRATRLAAIQALGADTASRADLVRLLQNSTEPLSVRRAALGALTAGDPDGLAGHALPMVASDQAPLDLRLRAIKAVEVRRTRRDPQPPDSFDRLMERLRTQSASPELRAAAAQYVRRTRQAR